MIPGHYAVPGVLGTRSSGDTILNYTPHSRRTQGTGTTSSCLRAFVCPNPPHHLTRSHEATKIPRPIRAQRPSDSTTSSRLCVIPLLRSPPALRRDRLTYAKTQRRKGAGYGEGLRAIARSGWDRACGACYQPTLWQGIAAKAARMA